MKTFFTSDLHFGHLNIIDYCGRPFKNVHHMNETLISNWNSIVSDDDEVYVIGDICMGQRDKTVPLVGRLNGYVIHLILGNHDACHPMFDAKHSYAASSSLYGQYFDVMDTQMTLETSIGDILMCHFPYNEPNKPDYQGRDFSAWEPVDEGQILFCGHIHDKWGTKITPKGTPMLNVGVDIWGFRPVALEDLLLLAQTLKEKTK